jgi:hypothetical protein
VPRGTHAQLCFPTIQEFINDCSAILRDGDVIAFDTFAGWVCDHLPFPDEPVNILHYIGAKHHDLLGADGPAPATLAFCWAHVRRKFLEAQKFAPACQEVLALIGELYAAEADLPGWYALEGEERQTALEHRLAVRQQKSVPLTQRIRDWAHAQRSDAWQCLSQGAGVHAQPLDGADGLSHPTAGAAG